MKRHLIYIGILALAACTADDSYETADEAGRERADVPFTISISPGWEIDDDATRAAPPGIGSQGTGEGETSVAGDEGWAETEAVDRIRVVTFRRKCGLNPDTGKDYVYATPTADFVYDAKNDITLTTVNTVTGLPSDDHYTRPASPADGEHHHRRATGTLHKVYGYEYRCVAVAWRSTTSYPFPDDVHDWTGEDKFFSLNIHDGLTLDEFRATIDKTQLSTNNWREFLCGVIGKVTHKTDHLTQKVSYPPQLFYGYLHLTTDDNPIIQFAEQDKLTGDYNKTLPLSGLLLRGMAKVEVRIVKVDKVSWVGKHNVVWASLLADNVLQTVSLNSYDCFNAGYSSVGNNMYDAIDYKRSAGENQPMTLTAYLLPTKTRLGIRVRIDYGVAAQSICSGQIWIHNATTGDTPTGVISPDALDNVFYLRRNHKYIINLDKISRTQDNAHELD